MHISAGNYVMDQGNPRKPQLRDSLMKAVGTVIASNVVPYLQMTSVEFHNTSRREKEGKKEQQYQEFMSLNKKYN